MSSDLLPALWACTERKLAQVEITWSDSHSCCVVACADKYPEGSSAGEVIEIGKQEGNAIVFHAGTKIKDGCLMTNGGRILSVTGTGPAILSAVDSAYAGIGKISFPGISYRRDIARKVVVSCQ